MDLIFFITGCLGLAETIDLFNKKDFLIFMTDSVNPDDYDLEKVYGVEKWLFALDTLALFGISFHVGGVYGEIALMILIFLTLIAHYMVFKSPEFRKDKNADGKRKKGKRNGGKRVR